MSKLGDLQQELLMEARLGEHGDWLEDIDMNEVTLEPALTEEDIEFARAAVLAFSKDENLYSPENSQEDDRAAEGRVQRILDYLYNV